MTKVSSVSWQELGIISDDETGIAARVFVSTKGRVPVPMVQLGRLGPAGTDFFPSIIPEVSWAEGQGTLPALAQSATLPDGLAKKVQDMLRPHLVLPDADNLDEEDFKLIDLGSPAKSDAGLWCGLSCS